MHPRFHHADELSRRAIGAAIEVHRLKGPGLLESIYEKCLMHELLLQQISARQQVVVPVEYKGLTFDKPLKLDVLVDIPLGLLINFHEMRLVGGLSGLILPGADGAEEKGLP